MTGTLLIVLVCIIIMPFCFREVEENLEIFLFCMGVVSVLASGTLQKDLIMEIAADPMLYLITGAVFAAGLLFEGLYPMISRLMDRAVRRVPIRLLCALLVLCLGLASSVITAVVAALMLVELSACLPLKQEKKVDLCVLSCFSIGLGAALTPVGEPLAALVTGALNEDFFFLARTIGTFVLPAIVFLTIITAVWIGPASNTCAIKTDRRKMASKRCFGCSAEVLLRTGRIFMFVAALEFLSAGFRPMLEQFILDLSGPTLYWINILSAVLDNATLAAAEISPEMTGLQLRSVLMGLLISGGILIPGNIPNIICAERLGITSGQWARRGLPLGLILLTFYAWVLFVR